MKRIAALVALCLILTGGFCAGASIGEGEAVEITEQDVPAINEVPGETEQDVPEIIDAPGETQQDAPEIIEATEAPDAPGETQQEAPEAPDAPDAPEEPEGAADLPQGEGQDAMRDDGCLIANAYADPAPFDLRFLAVPQAMDFGSVPISARDRVIVRADPDWAIQIEDPRPAPGAWQLYARLAAPLAQAGDVIEGALILRGASDVPLTDVPLLVAAGDTDPEEPVQTVRWAADQGILLKIPALRGQIGPYASTIAWTLASGP